MVLIACSRQRLLSRRFVRENVAYFSQELNVRGNFGRFGCFWLLHPIFFTRFMAFTTKNSTAATIRKFTVTVINCP